MGGCPGGQRGPFQPTENQASVAGAAQAELTHKPKYAEGDSGHGCLEGTQRHCPSLHGGRRGARKPQFSWS